MLQTRQLRLHLDDAEQPEECPLPAGARWCTAHSADKSWEMAVYAEADIVSDMICATGFWEHAEPESMGASASDKQLVDIGANVGWYTFMFAQHEYNVLAIEPMTANRALINATMCKNPGLVSRITVAAVALTDRVEKPGQNCRIFSGSDNLGDGILCCTEKQCAEIRDVYIEREQVPLTTLDQVLASSNLDEVDVLKMDVEAHECHVLDGGATLFTRFQPKRLMIETRNFQERGVGGR